MLPNFIIAGAPKAGTTSLYHYLSEHPDIFLSHRKEILFFDSSFHKGLPWYESHFRYHKKERAVGDISPTYMHDPDVAKRMFETIPSVKIIFILRNPVERAYSHYWDLVGWKEDEGSFLEILGNPRSYKRGHSYIKFDILEMGFYYKHISNFLKYFSRSQIGIFLFDDLKENKEGFLNEIFDFLGVSKMTFDETQITKKHHTSRVNRSKLFGNILVSESLREIFLRTVPERAVPYLRRVYDILLNMNSKRIQSRPMNESERSYLKEQYHNDIINLQKFISRDLGHWLK